MQFFTWGVWNLGHMFSPELLIYHKVDQVDV